jgi:hypothetical protein
MVLKVYFKDKNDNETAGLLISTSELHTDTYGVIAKTDGTIVEVPIKELYHKQEFI